MRHDEMIKVIEHHKNGGEVEVANKGYSLWEDATSPCWDFKTYDYRIKEKPSFTYPMWFKFVSYLKENGIIKE